MNLFETNDLGGLPLRLNDLRFMQDAWREGASGFLSIFGLDPNTPYLISAESYVISLPNMSAGDYYIAYQNEIYKGDAFTVDLTALAPGENIYVSLTEVNDSAGSKIFANGITRETYKVRKAEMVTGFTPPTDGDVLQDTFDRKAVYGLRNILNTEGDVKMISGSLTNFDGSGVGSKEHSGWALCDGQNGRLDLRGRFVAGHDPSQVNHSGFNVIGAVGGSHEHTLTEDEIPTHDHNVTDTGHSHPNALGGTVGGAGSLGGNGVLASGIFSTSNTSASITEDTVGGGLPHNNKPEYVVLAFAQFVGF